MPQGPADGSAGLRIVSSKVTKRAPNGPPEATATNLSGAVASQPTGARRNGAKRRSVLAAVGAGIYCPLVLAVARARPQSRARPVRGRPRREAAGLPRGAIDLMYKEIIFVNNCPNSRKGSANLKAPPAWPNDQKLSHAAGDSRQPKTRSEN